jgi:peptidoglycan/xylan/chitin deacetylase (PgdA/CDA1 family)
MGLSHLALRIATQRNVVSFIERWGRRGAISQGPRGRAEVALTFDDGPHRVWTPKVLDALDRAGLKATFFVVGKSVASAPELVVEARRRGHEIGTHLYSHARETVTDHQVFGDELARSKDQLESLLGEPLRWLRFPYGSPGRQQPKAIYRSDRIATAYWTYSSHDSKARDADEIIARVRVGLRPGAILLMHDAMADEASLTEPYIAARDATVSALPRLGALLTERHLAAVTLSELMRGFPSQLSSE